MHLYGQAADMAAHRARSPARHSLAIVEDCCQAHLATSGGRPVGTIGVAGAFSFYPTKNLGALGDGGAVITNDRRARRRIKRLRNGGQTDRYHHVEPGVNTRLDEMQAAVLRARLPFLPAGRRDAARWRHAIGSGSAARRRRLLPPERDPGHVYHLFVVRTPARDALQAHLAANGIETLIHYPVPIPRQPALASAMPADCPVAARAVRRSAVAAAASRARRTTRSSRRSSPSAERTFGKDERVRALITGGAGFIGSHLSEALLDRRP